MPLNLLSSRLRTGATLLPMQTPALKAQLDYGFIFALRGQHAAYDNFLFNHYTGLCFLDDPKFEMWDPFDFYPAPRFTHMHRSGVLETQGLDLWSAPATPRSKLPALLREQIDRGYYVYAVADYFYIPDTFCYALKPYPHPLFIVGYRKGGDEFAVVGMFQKHSRGLSAIRWSSLIRNGYHGMVYVKATDLIRSIDFDLRRIDDAGLKRYAAWSHKYIETVRVNPGGRYDFNPIELAKDLGAYLDAAPRREREGRHSRSLERSAAVYGLGVYASWERLMRAVCTRQCQHFIHILVRTFWEHKDFMLERAIYARDVVGLPIGEATIQALREVAKAARRFRFLYIEAAMDGRVPVVEDWLRSLAKCRELEEHACTRFHDELLRATS